MSEAMFQILADEWKDWERTAACDSDIDIEPVRIAFEHLVRRFAAAGMLDAFESATLYSLIGVSALA